MKATILLGTLKTSGLSNTETLCEFLAERMERQGVRSEIVRLVDHQILPGTCSDMGDGDQWPVVLEKVLASEFLVIATPIWWDNHSSLVQRVIERLDELHDEVLAGKPSRLEGKCGAIVITGDSDGAQHIIGNLCNFFNAVGLLVPPYATLSVLWERQAKGETPTREELMEKYEKDYAETADRMVRQLREHAPRRVSAG
ncbi:MAG TPA: NAD(P)H-dependent oxidoreductase [Longimicrobiaceae bacterium]